MADQIRSQNGLASELFREELRRARGRAGLTQEELAERICYSAALVTAVETGRRAPTADFAARCDGAVGTDGLLGRVQVKVARESAPVWFRDWAAIEREAVLLRSWEPLVVPGLLQTREYAREIMCSRPGIGEEDAEQRVCERLERQAIFERENPPALFVVIDEGVLRREVGGPALMRDQLTRLIEFAARPKVCLQVVPASAGAHSGLCGPFMIASFDGTADVSYVDSAMSSQLVEWQEGVFALTLVFDTVRGAALPCRASADLIREVVSTWS
jgi:transcriptional regulator with XRE-family HTH domain